MPLVVKSPMLKELHKNIKSDVKTVKEFKLSDLIDRRKDERTGTTTYDINGPKIVGLLSSLLNLSDPMGVGGMGGLVFQPGYRAWNPKILERAQGLMNKLYRDFPVLERASKYTPTVAMNEKFGRPQAVAEWLDPSRMRPWGNIYVYQPQVDPTDWLPHEILHSAERQSPRVRQLATDLFQRSPIGTEDVFKQMNVSPRVRESEYFAYTGEQALKDYLGLGGLEHPLIKKLPAADAMSLLDMLSRVK